MSTRQVLSTELIPSTILAFSGGRERECVQRLTRPSDCNGGLDGDLFWSPHNLEPAPPTVAGFVPEGRWPKFSSRNGSRVARNSKRSLDGRLDLIVP